MLNALTIDVEDYYMVSAYKDVVKFEDWPNYESRVENNTHRMLDILDESNVKATFFVLGWVAEHHPNIVKEIQKRGHELASHGYNHRLIYDLSKGEFREETQRSKRLLEDLTGEKVIGYRAASFSIIKKTLWALDILVEEGFEYDSGIFPIQHDLYGFPEFDRFPVTINNGSGEILEIPLSTIRFFGKNIPVAGGGYLRLFPIKLLEWAIRSLNEKEKQPAIIYLHPWEIDSDQPKINGRILSAFRHRINLDKTIPKLKRLLTNFEFGPIKDVFADKLK